jgi:hypothetical protein
VYSGVSRTDDVGVDILEGGVRIFALFEFNSASPPSRDRFFNMCLSRGT